MVSRQQQQERRVELVRGAAGRLFKEQGYEATTVRQIAAAAGVSTGTVMGCGDKASLLLRTVADAIEDLLPSAQPVVADLDATEVVWRCFAPYFEFYSTIPHLARPYTVLLLSAGPDHPPLRAQADSFNAVVAERLRTSRPLADQRAAELTAEALFAAYLYALLVWVSGTTELDDAIVGFRRQIDWQLARFTH